MRTTNTMTKRHRRKLLLTTTLIAAGMLASNNTVLADVLVSTDVTGPVAVAGNETLEVTDNASVTTSGTTGDVLGLDANGGYNTVNNYGTINVNASGTASRGRGIELENNDYAKNAGTINVSSSVRFAGGIFTNSDSNTIINSGAIYIDSDVYSASSSANTNIYGIGAFSDDNEIENSGHIEINAIATSGGSSTNVFVNGIRTAGDDNAIKNSGHIEINVETIADDGASTRANGIFAFRSDNGTIENSGNIDVNTTATSTGGTLNNNAAGIQVFNGSDNEISNKRNIEINADAINTGGFANARAYGIHTDSVSYDNKITNEGSIEVNAMAASDTKSSARTYGILTYNSNTITNSGDIIANAAAIKNASRNSYANAYGIKASDSVANYGQKITNSGNIEATATTNSNGATSKAYAHGIDAGDGKEIENSGNIKVKADAYGYFPTAGAYGISAGNDNTISNLSDINVEVIAKSRETTGGYFFNSVRATARGIDAIGDDNFIESSGNVEVNVHAEAQFKYSTANADASGIYVNGNDNTIENSGNMEINVETVAVFKSRASARAYGIKILGDNNEINNSGTIVVNARAEGSNGTSAYAYGIYAVNAVRIIENSGDITVTATSDGSWATGIRVRSRNKVVNSGTISATAIGSKAFGIDAAGDDNIIENSGFIDASSIGTGGKSYGIKAAGDNNEITNSGQVLASADSSANAYALFLSGKDNTVNLEAPSFLAGHLQFGSSAFNALNITTGASHSVLWTLKGTLAGGAPVIDGTTTGFWNATTQQFATFDPTGFAAANDWLADRTSMIFDGLHARGQARPAEGDAGDQSFDVWATGLGSISKYDGDGSATIDHDIDQYGVMAGVDFELLDQWALGLLAGYIDGSMQADSLWSNSYDNDASGFFGGVHAGTDMGRIRIEAAFLLGQLDHSNSRFVNDNLQTNGIDYAQSNFSSFWISPELAISTDFAIAYDTVVTPTLRGRYAAQWIDGYTETGATNANAVVGDQTAAVGEVLAEIAATRTFDFGTITGRAGVLGRFGMGDDMVNVTMIGTTNAVSTQTADRTAGYVGMETSIWLTDNTALNMSGQAMIGDDMTRYQGSASIGVKF